MNISLNRKHSHYNPKKIFHKRKNNSKMKQKRTIMTVLTVLILIIIGLRMGGYRDYIPSAVVWVAIALQLGLSNFWKPTNP
jgi:predicted RND superfamily exporter protein